MSISEKLIRERARARIAKIFSLSIEDVQFEMLFSTDFRASHNSFLKRNEFDKVLDDIRDVASPEIAVELNNGSLVINTVDDYCNHMIRCYSFNPREVASLLSL